MPRLFRRAGCLALVMLGLPAAAHPASAGAERSSPVERVLVVSIPGLDWRTVSDGDVPNLRAFFERAAVADLVPRSVRNRSRPGDAYLTIGAGTRAIGDPEIDGAQYDVTERLGAEDAGDRYRVETGRRARAPIVSLGWPDLERRNDGEPYDADLGLLADTLAAADVAAAAIANADGTDEDGAQRQGALALADRDGEVAGGQVGPGLLAPDGALDDGAVRDAFERAWTGEGRKVVLVELSQLARAASGEGGQEAWRDEQRRALASADALAGELLDAVDPERDAVLVVSPYQTPRSADLQVAALRAPGVPSGYLHSGVTQRAGLLTLVDLAPTTLHLLGLEARAPMEGRPAEVAVRGDSFEDRVDALIRIQRGAELRDDIRGPLNVVLVVLLGVVAVGAASVVAHPRRRLRLATAGTALALLSVVPATYLVRLLPLERIGAGGSLALIGAVTVLLAAAGLAGRRWLGSAATVPLVLCAVLPLADALTGARMQLNGPFGYSPTANSRLYGISNYSFSLVASAVLVLIGIAASRIPPRRRALVTLAAGVPVLVVLGVPGWGADVGGVLAWTPTLLVLVLLLSGTRLRWTWVVGALGATAVAIAAFGAVDLARPSAARTHLGRLLAQIGDEGLQPFLMILQRKLEGGVEASTHSVWVLAIPVTVALALVLRHASGQGSLEPVRQRSVPYAVAVACAVVAALGSVLNDSGAVVAGVVLYVAGASLVLIAMESCVPGSDAFHLGVPIERERISEGLAT